jgi:hypothetical protein
MDPNGKPIAIINTGSVGFSESFLLDLDFESRIALE